MVIIFTEARFVSFLGSGRFTSEACHIEADKLHLLIALCRNDQFLIALLVLLLLIFIQGGIIFVSLVFGHFQSLVAT